MPKIIRIDSKRIQIRALRSDLALGYVERREDAFVAVDLEGGETPHLTFEEAVDRLTGWLRCA